MRKLLLLLALVGCSSKEETPKPDLLHVASPDWSRQIIYFVMPDRFADGDPDNDDQGAGEYDPANGDRYSGGDLQGILDHLDYIQGLGATAIWITPPVANMWWDPRVSSAGYHGYWARDLKSVDEHLGTMATYQALARELHRRGMYLIQDVVPNHMGNFFSWDGTYDPEDPTKNFVRNLGAKPTGTPEPPFDQNDVTDPGQREAAIYHWTPEIADFTDPVQETDWEISDLDDLNTENPVVRAALKDAYGSWIRNAGVDAFRVDTAKFVPHEFWNDFFHAEDGILSTAASTGRSDFLAFGEVFEEPLPFDDTADRRVASYLGSAAKPELPAVLQFPLYAEIKRVFGGARPTSGMTYRLQRALDPALFPHPERMPTFLDNHDVSRFLASAGKPALRQALVFLYTIPGIPVVYYGTEQSFTETRGSMFAKGWRSDGKDHFDTGADGYELLAALAAMRRGNAVLTGTALEVLQDAPGGAGPFVYARGSGTDRVLVILNTSDEPALLARMPTGLPDGTITELLHAEGDAPDLTIARGGTLTTVLPARAAVVARATSRTQDPGEPPVAITVGTPVNGETFTEDVTIEGTVAPASTKLTLVLDGHTGGATAITPAADGSFSVVLPVSQFPPRLETHELALWAPDAKVSSDRYLFQTNPPFDGVIVEVADPAGDDDGPAHSYRYPTHATFKNQMDITGVTVEAGTNTLTLRIAMAEWSTVWNPSNGFDHVCFDVFFDVPGKDGVTFLPKLQASMPDGLAWDFWHFAGGWNNTLYRSEGATPTNSGTAMGQAGMSTQAAAKTVILQYDRTKLGLDTWEGTKIYLTTWDFDGIGANFRPISLEGDEYVVGGGEPGDPYIMDDVPPITVPALP